MWHLHRKKLQCNFDRIDKANYNELNEGGYRERKQMSRYFEMKEKKYVSY